MRGAIARLAACLSSVTSRQKCLEEGFAASVNVVVALTPYPHLVMIERSVRSDDPWSGDMAFPGGRKKAGEDTIRVAAREAEEEVCLSRGCYEVIGCMDPEAPLSRPSLRVVPVVSLLRAPECLPRVPCSPEATRVALVPVPARLESMLVNALHPVRGLVIKAYKDWYGNYVWGLSLRIMEKIADRLYECWLEAMEVCRLA
ncbi:MAG: NUDIX domain-containing protein [Thermoproteota archaeon]